MRAIIEPKDQPRLIHRSTKRSGSHPSSKKREPECCFYKNPTLLSRLILHQKYAEALRRCQQHPDEAAVWLCVKRLQEPPTLDATATGDHRTGNEVCSMRQLPLHMACQDLSRVGVEAGNRNQLEELICHLVLANPPGCSRQDHSGRWALHEAVWCAAKPDTISALLCAAPEIANSNDQYGRSTIYLNHHCRVRTPDAQARVQEMLLRGTEFWEMARQEANLRLKHRTVPYEDASIDSLSVLASGTQNGGLVETYGNGGGHDDDMSTVLTMDQSRTTTDQQESQALTPWSWSQLEQRAQRLEQLLAESLEKEFKATHTMSNLEAKHAALQEKCHMASESSHAKVIKLEDENVQLQQEKQQLQALVQWFSSSVDEGGLASEPGVGLSVPVAAEDTSASAAAEAIHSLRQDKQKLEAQVASLTRKNDSYVHKLGYFERVLDSFSKGQTSDGSMTLTSVASGVEHLSLADTACTNTGGQTSGSQGSNDFEHDIAATDELSLLLQETSRAYSTTASPIHPSRLASLDDYGASANEMKSDTCPVSVGIDTLFAEASTALYSADEQNDPIM